MVFNTMNISNLRKRAVQMFTGYAVPLPCLKNILQANVY